MKKIVHRYHISKFNRFISGLLFATISYGSLAYCLTNIAENSASQVKIVLPFIMAIISMLLGFISMFRNYGTAKEMV